MFKLTFFLALAALIYDSFAMPLSDGEHITSNPGGDWVSVEFEGDTIWYNATVFHDPHNATSANLPTTNLGTLETDWCNSPPSYNQIADGTQWATASDCRKIGEWMAQASTRGEWGVWTKTGDYHLIASLNTCGISMGTNNYYWTGFGKDDGVELFKGADQHCVVRTYLPLSPSSFDLLPDTD